MLQLVLTLIIYLILVIPVGRYLYHIAAGKHTFADPVLDRVDGTIYKLGGVDPHQGMNWKQYAMALIGTNAVMIAIGYIIHTFSYRQLDIRLKSNIVYIPFICSTDCFGYTFDCKIHINTVWRII